MKILLFAILIISIMITGASWSLAFVLLEANKQISLEKWDLKNDIKDYKIMLNAVNAQLRICKQEKQDFIDRVYPPARK